MPRFEVAVEVAGGRTKSATKNGHSKNLEFARPTKIDLESCPDAATNIGRKARVPRIMPSTAEIAASRMCLPAA